jgi:uncharacterized protein (DUF1330 family)
MERRLLALSRHHDRADPCQLSGEERTSRKPPRMSAQSAAALGKLFYCASHNVRSIVCSESLARVPLTEGLGKTMAKAYWVVCYRLIFRPHSTREVQQAWRPRCARCGRALPHPRCPCQAYEHGMKEHTVVIEFESLAQAVAAHDSPAYEAALAVLGNAAERDFRIVEGLD